MIFPFPKVGYVSSVGGTRTCRLVACWCFLTSLTSLHLEVASACAMSEPVLVVGGGLAGLCASIEAARDWGGEM